MIDRLWRFVWESQTGTGFFEIMYNVKTMKSSESNDKLTIKSSKKSKSSYTKET